MIIYQVDFKTKKIEKEWRDLVDGRRGSSLLLPLAMTTIVAISEISGSVPLITCIWRPPSLYGYPSVHELGRGIDFRVWKLTADHVERIEDRVNSSFIYRAGSGRILPALAFHIKGTGKHLHGQVPAADAWRT